MIKPEFKVVKEPDFKRQQEYTFRALQTVVRYIVTWFIRALRDTVPVRTGALKASQRSGGLRVVETSRDKMVFAHITAGFSLAPVNYAPFVAFGTYRTGANRWHSRAFRQELPRIRGRLHNAKLVRK